MSFPLLSSFSFSAAQGSGMRRARGVIVAVGAVGALAGAVAARAAAPEVSAGIPGGGVAAHGRALARSCAACHGLDGNATSAQFPKLAGQGPEYIVQELGRFKAQGGKAPERLNPIMNGIAAGLSTQDMRDLGTWYAAQTIKPAIAVNREWVDDGERIWRGGIADRRVPACAACHGPGGLGMPPQYPRLAGQWAGYLADQMHAFRTGARADQGPMHAIASRMSDRQIRDVSEFAAGLR